MQFNQGHSGSRVLLGNLKHSEHREDAESLNEKIFASSVPVLCTLW